MNFLTFVTTCSHSTVLAVMYGFTSLHATLSKTYPKPLHVIVVQEMIGGHLEAPGWEQTKTTFIPPGQLGTGQV